MRGCYAANDYYRLHVMSQCFHHDPQRDNPSVATAQAPPPVRTKSPMPCLPVPPTRVEFTPGVAGPLVPARTRRPAKRAPHWTSSAEPQLVRASGGRWCVPPLRSNHCMRGIMTPEHTTPTTKRARWTQGSKTMVGPPRLPGTCTYVRALDRCGASGEARRQKG